MDYIDFSIIFYRYVVLISIRGTANSLFAVIDGHGVDGHIIAEFIKQFLSSFLFLDALMDVLKSAGHDILQAYTKFFNVEILRLEKSLVAYAHLHKEIDFEGSGATLSLLFLNELNLAVVVQIGDSSVIGFIGGRAETILPPHKPDNDEEKHRILKAQGFVERENKLNHWRVNGVLTMSRAIGDFKYKRDMDTGQIKHGNTIIIATPDISISDASK